ncbi:MAG: hypothetical protein ACI9EF_001285 [Pseudohongiellaceae bacterium]|jgi:hypothetical protein
MRSERAAVGAAVWLVLVLVCLVAGWVWYASQLAPDYRVDAVVRLNTDLAPGRSTGVTLSNGTREAWSLDVDDGPLRFFTTVAGDEPLLRFHEGYLRGIPSLGVWLIRKDGSQEQLAELESTENVWSEHQVKVPADAGQEIELQFRALDGKGRSGLGKVYLANVSLLSSGRPVDETASTVSVSSIVADLLSGSTSELVRAPPTEASARVGMLGPLCLPLTPHVPLQLALDEVPARAMLHLVTHTGRLSEVGAVEPTWMVVRAGIEELARVRVDSHAVSLLGRPPSREALITLDLAAHQGRSFDLVFEVLGGDSLFVGLREAYVIENQERIRKGFDPERSRNVLMLVVDGLRYDRLGVSGYTRGHTPNLDALAKRGLVYSHLLAPSSWPLPNVATLLSGLSPIAHGVGLRPGRVLSPRVTTMAQSAAWAGTMTACFRNTDVITAETGLNAGYQDNVWRFLPATTLAEEARDWLVEAGQFQWFLTVHVNDPIPPHESEGADLLNLAGDVDEYLVSRLAMLDSRPGAAEAMAIEMGQTVDSEITRVDRALGILLDELRRQDLFESTLVAVVGSSGQEFYEHNGRHNGQTLYDEVVEVPLIVAGPGISTPEVIDDPIPLVDGAHLIGDLGRMMTAGSISGGLPPPFGPQQPDRVIHAVLRPYQDVTRHDLESSRRNEWLYVRERNGTLQAVYDRNSDPLAWTDLLPAEADGVSSSADRGERAAAEADALGTAFEAWYERELRSSAAWPVPWSVPWSP